MGSQRRLISYLLLGLLVAVVGIGIGLGVALDSDPMPQQLSSAVNATLHAQSYTVTSSVQTSLTPYSSANGSGSVTVASQTRTIYQAPDKAVVLTGTSSRKLLGTGASFAVGSSLYQRGVAVTSRLGTLDVTGVGHNVPNAAQKLLSPVTAYLQAVSQASNVQGSGSTYIFRVPSSSIPHTVLPGYSWQQATVQMSVTIGGGFVRSITVNVLAIPSTQLHHLVFTSINSAPHITLMQFKTLASSSGAS